jgi:hypothetical protein
MRDCTPNPTRSAPRLFGWFLVGVLALGVTGCVHNDHLTMGANEKWVASDQHMIPKSLGTLIISPFDAIFAPWFNAIDQMSADEGSEPQIKYLSFSGSRTLALADQEWGYHVIGNIFTIPVDIVYLLLTGPVDIIWVLASDDTSDEDEG